MPLLVAPNGADNALARRASVLGGLTTTLSATRPSSVGGGLASRLAADISSTTRLEAATPTPAHRTALRELDNVRRNSYDVDRFIDHLRRVNGNVECNTAAAIGCCVVVITRHPCISPSCTPGLPFMEPLFPLPIEPSLVGTDLVLRLADDVTIAPAALASIIGFHSLHPVVSFLDHRYSCTALDVDGNINYSADSHTIYTLSGLRNGSPAWMTSLVTWGYLEEESTLKAIAAAVPLPLWHVSVGKERCPDRGIRSDYGSGSHRSLHDAW